MRKLKVTEMGRLTLGEFRETEKQPIAVVLDHVRSLHNVGSVFRTSDAFCIEEVLLCGITAQPPHPEIHKTALGAEESVNWCLDTLTPGTTLSPGGTLLPLLDSTVTGMKG